MSRRALRVLIFAVAHLTACDESGRLDILPVLGRFEPSAVDFGRVPLGWSKTRSIALVNSGSSRLTITGVEVPDDFVLVDAKEAVLGRTLAGSDRLEFTVRFEPRSQNRLRSTLTLRSRHSAFELPVQGIGVFSPLSAAPSAVDFGTVTVGDEVESPILLTNTGAVDVTIDRVLVGATEDFFTAEALPLVIAAGQSRMVDVVFAPTRAGDFQDTLRFVAMETEVAALELRAIALEVAPAVECGPERLDFGEVVRGDTVARQLRCTALGRRVRINRATLVQGQDEGFHLVVPQVPINLSRGQSIHFDVLFDSEGLQGGRTGLVELEYSGSRGTSGTLIELTAMTMPPPPSGNDFTIVLRWDTFTDVDLHLVRPGGGFFRLQGDCFFAAKTPDWGEDGVAADDPYLDEDNVVGRGPETINLREATPGRYEVWAHYFEGPISVGSRVSVEVLVRGRSVAAFERLLRCTERWRVGFIDWNGDRGTFLPDDFQSAFSVGQCI